MNTRNLVISKIFATMLVTIPAIADVPSIYGSCPSTTVINLPEDSAGVALDKECKTVYYLPSVKKEASITGFVPNVSLEDCLDVNDELKEELNAIDELRKRKNKLESSNAAQSEIDTLKRYIKEHQEEKEKIVSWLNGPGGKVNISLKTVDGSTYHTDMIAKNLQLITGSRINFQPVSIADAYLTFSPVEANVGLGSVVKINIPGFRLAKTVDQSALDVKEGNLDISVISNGQSAGEVWVTKNTSCKALTSMASEKIPYEKTLGPFLNPVFTYSYFVRANYGFEINLHLEQLKERLAQFLQTKSQFSVDEMDQLLEHAREAQEVEVKIELDGVDEKIKSNLTERAVVESTAILKESITRALTSQLPQIAATTDKKAPDGGNVTDHVGDSRVCRTSTDSFLGVPVSSSSSCFMQPIYRVRWVNGTLEEVRKALESVKLDLHYVYKIGTLVPRFGTSTFEFKGK